MRRRIRAAMEAEEEGRLLGRAEVPNSCERRRWKHLVWMLPVYEHFTRVRLSTEVKASLQDTWMKQTVPSQFRIHRMIIME